MRRWARRSKREFLVGLTYVMMASAAIWSSVSCATDVLLRHAVRECQCAGRSDSGPRGLDLRGRDARPRSYHARSDHRGDERRGTQELGQRATSRPAQNHGSKGPSPLRAEQD
eukprot:scaffold63924_cov62-Phaeocystis_antarctica.AAC.7